MKNDINIPNLNIIKSSFHPIGNLKDRNNYKIYHRIEKDGTIIERVFLDIPDMSVRERLICLHFLKNEVLTFYNKEVAFNIISRDEPWDFKIDLSTNEVFNIEITSIAENSELFEKLKKEERFFIKSFEKEVPLHELVKLNNFFPSDSIKGLIDEYNKKGFSKSGLVKNPYFENRENLFISSGCYKKNDLANIIKEVITKKENKKHAEKENTVIIIDNRTLTYEYSDLELAINELEQFFKLSIFKEIWFYTGYCTDLNGNNAEFSLAPLKISSEKRRIIEKSIKKYETDENGITYV